IELVAACTPTATVPPAGETPAQTSPVTGVVIAVDSAGLADVRSFTLRTDSGFAYQFEIGALENATEFPLGHLGEHLATSEPVRVWFRDDAQGRVAYRIEDAGE
ncbi:MAG TPA: hypothetical protein VK831_01905, partial [Candidatus Deferrimicrobiaceae bacterium]|nr:hypothetical protein [Candidatus Deferrimicrobiaceae bacterium]